MKDLWDNGKYEVLKVEVVFGFDGKAIWKVDLGIRRAWPLSWFDHRPWNKFPQRHYPIRSFEGSGYAWIEKREGYAFACSNLVPVLNAIVSKKALEMISDKTTTVVISQRLDYVHAEIKDQPGIWGSGKNSEEALGSVILSGKEVCNINIIRR